MSNKTDPYKPENAVNDHSALEHQLNEWYHTSLKVVCGVIICAMLVRLGVGYAYARLECEKGRYEDVLHRHDEYTQTQAHNTLVQKQRASSKYVRDFLSTIAAMLPREVRLESIAYEYGKNIRLRGTALKIRELLVFLEEVKRGFISDRFANCYPVSIERDEEQDTLTFAVTVPFEALQNKG